MSLFKTDTQVRFIFLDDQRNTLATAVLRQQSGQTKMFELSSAPSADLTTHGEINVMSVNSQNFMAWRGTVQGIRGRTVYFDATEHIDSSLRRHLRVDMRFTSCLYPLDKVGPRIPIVSCDVSCGGIALISREPLDISARYELVFPSRYPLLLPVRVLRMLDEARRQYVCVFDNILLSEEAIVQETIFDYDIRRHRSGA